MSEKILVFGCGNMGEAILSAAVKNGISADIVEKNPGKVRKLAAGYNVRKASSDEKYSLAVLAVKPQDKEEAVSGLRNFRFDAVLTILAGVKTTFFEKKLGKIPILRAMPNLPLTAGKGMTGIYASKNFQKYAARKKILKVVEKLFPGKILYLKKENLLNGITAISGSGPAYVCYFIESLEEAARKLGFKKDAAVLARMTFEGTLALLKEKKLSPEILRKKVTSPGGTTEQAIKVMEKKHLKKIVAEACLKASTRAEKLGG